MSQAYKQISLCQTLKKDFTMTKVLAGTIPNYFKQHGKQVSWIKDVTAYGDGRKDIQSRNSYKKFINK